MASQAFVGKIIVSAIIFLSQNPHPLYKPLFSPYLKTELTH